MLAAIAALVIIGGFIALGAPSPAGEVAVETTTTLATTTTPEELAPPFDPENFEVSQIETGPQFEWTHTLTVEEGFPLGLIEHRGSLYLFVTQGRFWIGEPGDLTIWEWDGSGDWVDRGSVVGDDHTVVAMTSHRDEVILVGSPVEGGAVSVWRSTDLSTWSKEEIALDNEDHNRMLVQAAVGSDGHLIVVSAWLSLNPRIVFDALQKAGYPVSMDDVGWGLEDDAVVIYGPLGVTAERVPYADLGWDEDAQSAIVSSYHGPSGSRTWAKRGEEEWEKTQIPGIRGVEAITPHPGGGVVATGWGPSDRLSAVSTDGVEWSALSEGATATWGMKAWGDLLVGPTDRSLPGVALSDDGQTWEVIGPGDRFPTGIHWSTEALAASSDGVIFATGGVSPGLPPTPPTERVSPIRLRLPEDDATLVIDFETGRLDLESDSGIYSWQMYSSAELNGITADLQERTLVFSHPETDAILATVGFDVLEQAQEDFNRDRAPARGHHALVFSPDGSTWTIQDIGNQFGESSRVGELSIGSGHVAATVAPDLWAGTADPTFEIWTAPLP